jgi:hypothetical protein
VTATFDGMLPVPCSGHVHRLHALYDCHSLIHFGNSHIVILFVDMHEGFAEKGFPMLWCSSCCAQKLVVSLLLQCHLK